MKTEEKQSKKKNRPGQSTERKKNSQWQWIITIFLVTILISGCFSWASNQILNEAALLVAFLVLLFIIAIGILFDIIGVAVTAASEKPFHGMAARKVKGAAECIRLLRNASRVSSFCNDVIGDICGVISGSAAAVIAAEAVSKTGSAGLKAVLLPLLLSALVAGLTVGGKAVGKTLAIRDSTGIVFLVGRVIAFLKNLPACLKTGRAGGRDRNRTGSAR